MSIAYSIQVAQLIRLGDVAALLRSHMIGLLPFESTIEQTNTRAAATMIKQKQLWTAATLLIRFPHLAIVYTSRSNCHTHILQFESHSYRIGIV